MPPKTERFELRLDEDILNRIDQWRSRQPELPTRAEAMRRLVEIALAPTSSENVQLSDGEKLIMGMLCDVSKHLGINGPTKSNTDFIESALCGGHYWALKWQKSGLLHNHVDKPENLTFVVDVLDMWDFVESGYEALSGKAKTALDEQIRWHEFPGFDGNNEAELLGIARFLINDLERFSRFKERKLNSHMPTRKTYQQMLDVFEPMRVTLIGRELAADQLLAIFRAKTGQDTAAAGRSL